jgi:hypothetical protein
MNRYVVTANIGNIRVLVTPCRHAGLDPASAFFPGGPATGGSRLKAGMTEWQA